MSAPVQVQVCGNPHLVIDPETGCALVRVLLHTTDPDSHLHAQISIEFDPATGTHDIQGEWLLDQ